MFEDHETIIAVISDLHIGDSARSQDLTPHIPTEQTKKHETEYLTHFQSFISQNNIRADYLIISGDISSRAKAEEFAHASRCIEGIANDLEVPADHIAFVPGNHDVDWGVLSNLEDDTTNFRWQQRYAPLKHGTTLFTEAMRCNTGDFLDTPFVASWDFPDLFIIGYNSAWNDDPEVSIHHGLIDQTHIDHIDRLLNETEIDPNKLRLFLVHHHPIMYSNPIPSEPDFSAMQNADNLLRTLRTHQFDLLIHGHKHCPHFRASIENSGFPLAILGAGSFSADLGNGHYFENISNQFHLIKVKRRSGSDDCIKGVVQSWGYLTGHGWQPSVKFSNGIDHQQPFGTYLLPSEIKRMILPDIRNAIRRRGHVRWSWLIQRHTDYKYLPIDTAESVLRGIASELDCDFLPSSLDGATEFVLATNEED